jgi:hypothetical protein
MSQPVAQTLVKAPAPQDLGFLGSKSPKCGGRVCLRALYATGWSMHELECSLTLSRSRRRLSCGLFHCSGRKSDRRIQSRRLSAGGAAVGARVIHSSARPCPRSSVVGTVARIAGTVEPTICRPLAYLTCGLGAGFRGRLATLFEFDIDRDLADSHPAHVVMPELEAVHEGLRSSGAFVPPVFASIRGTAWMGDRRVEQV